MRRCHATFGVRSSTTCLFRAFSLLPTTLIFAFSGLRAGGPNAAPAELQTTAGLYLEVQLPRPVKVSALRPGDTLTGKLYRDVYSEDREVFPAGSTVHLLVGKLERRKREPNDHWPGVIRLFEPRHENYPTLQSASVSLPSGPDVPLQVSLILITRPVEVRAPVRAKTSAPPSATFLRAQGSQSGAAPVQFDRAAGTNDARGKKASLGQTLILEARWPEQFLASRKAFANTASSAPVTVTAGTEAQVVLLGSLSASKSRPGDSFRTRLLEPVRSGSRVVLPAGGLFDGTVVKSRAPCWLSRPGSLYLAFTGLTLPGGNRRPVVADLSAVQADRRSHLRLDAEGELSGARPGKAWMLINLGVTAGVAKEADDATQLIIEGLVATATDASTAGTARIVGACASGIFMVTRHGRDVLLPRFTEMDITFTRPVSMQISLPGKNQANGDGR